MPPPEVCGAGGFETGTPYYPRPARACGGRRPGAPARARARARCAAPLERPYAMGVAFFTIGFSLPWTHC